MEPNRSDVDPWRIIILKFSQSIFIFRQMCRGDGEDFSVSIFPSKLQKIKYTLTLKSVNAKKLFMIISDRKVSIPFVADAKLPIFWPGSKNYDFLHQICDFKGKNWRAGLRRLKFLSLIDQNICKKNDQNSVFLSEALHGKIIIKPARWER